MAIFLLRSTSGPAARSNIESELLATIPDLVETSNFNQVFDLTKRGEPATVLVVGPPGDQRYLDRLVEVATQYRNEIFVILISDEISASDYKRLVRTGGADWASARAGPREVTDIIARRRQHVRSPDVLVGRPNDTQKPVTISFVPGAGGVGNTTLIVETAVNIKKNEKTQQRKICIVDLDFQTSHVCDYLDSEPRLHIEEFSSAPERLDQQLLESFTTRHSSGIDVFAAPRSKFSIDTLNINALDALFNAITERYNLIFIDHPLTWFSWTTQVIVASDGAIITGLNTIPGLRQISETLALVRSSGPRALQIAVALNRCERNLLGSVARRNYVQRVLRDERTFLISHRPEAVASVNMGIPMTLGATARKLQKEFAPLADFCSQVKTTRQASA
jgi:pilus assembly protein CpaE